MAEQLFVGQVLESEGNENATVTKLSPCGEFAIIRPVSDDHHGEPIAVMDNVWSDGFQAWRPKKHWEARGTVVHYGGEKFITVWDNYISGPCTEDQACSVASQVAELLNARSVRVD